MRSEIKEVRRVILKLNQKNKNVNLYKQNLI